MVNLNIVVVKSFVFFLSVCTLLKKSAVGICEFHSAVVVIIETHVLLYIPSFSLLFLPRMLNEMQGPISAMHSLTVIECLRGILAAQ